MTGNIHTPLGMVPYINKFTAWLPTVGARLLIRDLQGDVREGAPGSVNIIVEFDTKDVVRHGLVQKIVEAYAKFLT